MVHPEQESPQSLTVESPLATFDPQAMLTRVLQEEGWLKGNDRALVLAKTDRMRVVLRALHAGSALPTHKADGPITVQVLTGRIEFTTESRTVGLKEGELLALRAGVPHSVRALDQSAILITVAAEDRKV